MTTQEIMELALEMAGFTSVPPDSAIYVPGMEIRKVLFGIDIDTAELMLARELKCDAVISHHPHGAMINWYLPEAWRVYATHLTLLKQHGIPEDEAVAAVEPGLLRWSLECQGSNYDRTVSIARLLNIPFMNIHQPLDEIGRRIIQAKIDETIAEYGPRTRVQDLVDSLATIPELARAKTEIRVMVGDPQAKVGKAVMVHGALTNGGYEVAATYFRHGIDTIVYIHAAPDVVARLRKEHHGNLIVTGHIASDAVGIMPFIAALRARGLEVIPINGLS